MREKPESIKARLDERIRCCLNQFPRWFDSSLREGGAHFLSDELGTVAVPHCDEKTGWHREPDVFSAIHKDVAKVYQSLLDQVKKAYSALPVKDPSLHRKVDSRFSYLWVRRIVFLPQGNRTMGVLYAYLTEQQPFYANMREYQVFSKTIELAAYRELVRRQEGN